MKVALLSDIHANIFALEAVLEDLRRENIDRILVAGDLVGYYYWPKEVVGLLKGDSRVSCIRGNHEVILGEVLASPDAAIRYRSKYGSGYEVCRETLSADELRWLVTLPESLTVDIDGCSFHVAHGSLSSADEYLYPDAGAEVLERNYSNSTVTVFGHTHYPFLHARDERLLINPGSVGQPRDAGGMASYVIVNTENHTVRFRRKLFEQSKLVDASKSRDPELKYLWTIMSR